MRAHRVSGNDGHAIELFFSKMEEDVLGGKERTAEEEVTLSLLHLSKMDNDKALQNAIDAFGEL